MRINKKLLAVALVFIMVFTLVPVTALASDTITVTIDGQAVDFEDQEPAMVSNRVLVPVRFVFEDLGFEVDWDRTTRTATLERDDYVVVITIGSTSFTINGARHELDVPAQLVGGRTMIPLGPVLRGVGYKLDWVGSTRTVVITTETNEVIDTATVQREQHLARFNMSLQYTSENFYWYSTDERSHLLPAMAQSLEDNVSDLLEVFGVTLTQRTVILYYSSNDFNAAYPEMNRDHQWPSGHAGPTSISLTVPIEYFPEWYWEILEELGHEPAEQLLIHEFVHVLQSRYVIDWETMEQLRLGMLWWVLEGTADYFARQLRYCNWRRPWAIENVVLGNIPTLDDVEAGFMSEDEIYYRIWAASIFDFISDAFGVEYIVEMNRLHGDFEGIFGFSRNEFQRQWHQWLRDNYR